MFVGRRRGLLLLLLTNGHPTMRRISPSRTAHPTNLSAYDSNSLHGTDELVKTNTHKKRNEALSRMISKRITHKHRHKCIEKEKFYFYFVVLSLNHLRDSKDTQQKQFCDLQESTR